MSLIGSEQTLLSCSYFVKLFKVRTAVRGKLC